VWCPNYRPDGSGRSAPTCMVCFLPNEFMAPANQVVQEEAVDAKSAPCVKHTASRTS
jgi:hypothetical protein